MQYALRNSSGSGLSGFMARALIMVAKTPAGDFTTALLTSRWQRGRSSLPESLSQDVHQTEHIPLAADQTSLQLCGCKQSRLIL